MTTRPRTSIRLVPVLLLGLVGLAGCGSSAGVTSPNSVFTVNGKDYSTTKFDALVTDLISAGQVTATDGRLSAQDARSIIKTLIEFESFGAFAKDRGISVSEADRATVISEAQSDPSFGSYPKDLQDLLIELNIAGAALGKVAAPSASELRSLYDASPASSGILCLSHILVKTETEARAVISDLNDGADFATEARSKSIEPAAKTSGGELKSGDELCSALSELQRSFDKDFLAGAVAAKPGVPTGPVKSSFGYHVILSRPYDDVKESVARVMAKSPGNTLLIGYMTGAKISVNSKYGRWNSATANIE